MLKQDIKQLGRVAVVLGGDSGEREVSLLSGEAVLNALTHQGIDAYPFDPSMQDVTNLESYDRVFIALHGKYGEDGTIQRELDSMQVPYTGSGVTASAIGMDKWQTKLQWQEAGVVTPAFELLHTQSDFLEVEQKLGFPIFVKPANEGSSIGITKVKKTGELQAAYELAAEADPLVIAEASIDAGEYTVGILGKQALPIIRIVPKNEFYDFDAKYIRDDTEYLCPCGLSAEVEAKIKQEALDAFHALGCSGWGRVDFLMDEAGKHYFLEVNTSPGMTDHSLVPMAAEAAGISFDALVVNILQMTLEGATGSSDVA
jgi:D-alanine-D-alanine ligase